MQQFVCSRLFLGDITVLKLPSSTRADLLPHYLSVRRSLILSLQQQPSLSLGPSAPVLGACSASLENLWRVDGGRLGLAFQSLCPLSTADAPGHPVHPQHCCSDLDFVGIVAVGGLFVHSMSESSC